MPSDPADHADHAGHGSLPAARRGIAWERVALPLLTLEAVALSLVLCGQLLAMSPEARDAFLTTNTLAARSRSAMILSLMFGALIPSLAVIASLAAWRGRALAYWERSARVLGPLITLCLLPAVLNIRLAHQNQLTYLLLLAALVLMLEPLLRRSLEELATTRSFIRFRDETRWVRSLRLPSARVFFFTLVMLAAAGYAIYVGYYTILNHRRLGTTAFDLGIYDNLMFNALHGRLFKSTVLFGPAGGNYLAGHAEFAMLLFVPFYAIRPGPETMLIIQAVVLGFAAVPLYLFASARLSRPTAATIAVAYLMFAPLHGPNFYDFHWIPLAVFFHFWLYYAIVNRKQWLTAAMVVILFAIREDVAVGVAVLGLFLLLSGLRPRLGLVLAATAAAWFVIVRFVIMPLAGNWYFPNLYAGLFADGASSFGSVIKTILTNPLYTFGTLGSEPKVTYVGHMFVPLALLPCRRLKLLPLAAAGIFFTILTTGAQPMIQISFQYTTHWIPYLFLATVLTLILMSRQPGGSFARRAAIGTMVIAMWAHSYNFGAFLQHEIFVGGFSRIEFKMSDDDRKRYAGLRKLLAMIPPDATVAATEQETAHVSTRRIVYPLRVPPGPVDYILVGRSHVGELSRVPLTVALSGATEYGLLGEWGDELFLFKRGHTSPRTRDAKSKLGMP